MLPWLCTWYSQTSLLSWTQHSYLPWDYPTVNTSAITPPYHSKWLSAQSSEVVWTCLMFLLLHSFLWWVTGCLPYCTRTQDVPPPFHSLLCFYHVVPNEVLPNWIKLSWGVKIQPRAPGVVSGVQVLGGWPHTQ
jgi:hypothetical protein